MTARRVKLAVLCLVALSSVSAQDGEAQPEEEGPKSKCAKAYTQCGGKVQGKATYAGPTCCSKGYKCEAQSEFYSQCTLDESQATTKVSTTTTTVSVEDTGIKGQRPWDYFPKPQMKITVKPPTPATNPIVVKGNFLYDAVTQKRFYVKGLCYNSNPQPYTHEGTTSCKAGKPEHGPYTWGTDLISDEKEYIWREDLKVIADLGVNVVRLYDVDPEVSHAKFMAAAAEYGLYVIIPLTRAKWGFMPAGMASPDCYTGTIEGYGEVGLNLLTSAKLIVKQFSQYDNTLFFTVGNEVETSHKNGYAALPCVKALTRDIHAFQDSCTMGMRRVPLMYAATDVGGEKRKLIADYMMCELDTTDGVQDSVDVHGLNVYSWCDYNYTDEDGNLAWDRSPYYEIQRDFHGIPKPLIFSEFDCHEGAFVSTCPYKGGRTWPQLGVMTKEMPEYLSGGLAFEYSMEDNEFGLILKPGFLEGQDDLRLTDSYFALQQAYTQNDISSQWDGKWDETTRCSWTPSNGPFKTALLKKPKFPVAKSRQCPGAGAGVGKLFAHQYEGKVNPTWGSLPPQIPADVMCPSYALSAVVQAENCCLSDCTKAAAAAATTAAPSLEATMQAAPDALSVPAVDRWAMAVFQLDSLDLASLTRDEEARVRSVLAAIIADVGSSGAADRASVADLQGRPKQVSLQEVRAGGDLVKTTMVKGLISMQPDAHCKDIEALLNSQETKLKVTKSIRELLPDSGAVGPDLAVANVAVAPSGPENVLVVGLKETVSATPEQGSGSTFPWWGWLIASLVLVGTMALVFAVCVPALNEKKPKKKSKRGARTQPEEEAPAVSAPLVAREPAAVVTSLVAAPVASVQQYRVVQGPPTVQPMVQVNGYVPVLLSPPVAPGVPVRYA